MTPEKEQAERLKQAAKSRGYNSAADLARAAGMKESTARSALNGTRPLTASAAARYANFLMVDASWLLYGTKLGIQGGIHKQNQPVGSDPVNIQGATLGLQPHLRPDRMLTGLRNIPIVGYAKGGEDGFFLDQGVLIGMAYRPEMLEGVADAFAIEIWDDSMHPALKHGHIAFVHPNKTPRPGDEVLITLKDGQALVKELVRRTADTLTVRQWRPEKEFQIKQKDVDKVRLIVDSPRVRT